METETTEIVCIIDRSGSMKPIQDEAISGINCFLEDQAAVPGNALLTLVRFDNEYEIVHDGVPIAEVPKLDERSFRPRGMTALYDAIGRTVDDVGRRISRTPRKERPGHVIVAILTDGLENASSDYTSHRVREMIEHQQSVYSWDFVYLGANQDAFSESRKLGLAKESTRQWDSTSEGTMYALREMSSTVSTMRQPVAPTRRRNAQHKSKTGSSREAKSE